MIEIIPAVLPKSLEDLQESLSRLRGVTSFVQIDLVGSNIIAGEETIPFWEDFDFEADIMLPSPSREVRSCIDTGASKIIVHASAPDAREALEMLQETREGEYKVEVGVALGVQDTLQTLAAFENLYDYVQVMGIAHIGKQGEPPDPEHREIALITQLRAQYPELLIQVDGAAAAHPRELVEAGATRLIVGSAIVSADNPKSELQRLYNVANARS